MQTYYDVLGVSQNADDFVIKAAYKAMAQRYHPDKFANNARDAADAESKMRQINEAYQVLSDSVKRRDYDDSLRQQKQNQHQNAQHTEQQKQNEDWQIALRFYPDLTELETRLAKIDPSLVPDFRKILLSDQQYDRRQAIANQLEQDYLEGFFGTHPALIDCARNLLLAGHREIAKELNQTIKVVGNTITAEQIILQIEDKHFPHVAKQRRQGIIQKHDKLKLQKEVKAESLQNNLLIVFVVVFPIALFFLGIWLLINR